MPSATTVHHWKRRLIWPITLGTGWFVTYTSLTVFNAAFANPEMAILPYLFSARHLTHPLGWLFIASLVFVLIGAGLKSYEFMAGY